MIMCDPKNCVVVSHCPSWAPENWGLNWASPKVLRSLESNTKDCASTNVDIHPQIADGWWLILFKQIGQHEQIVPQGNIPTSWHDLPMEKENCPWPVGICWGENGAVTGQVASHPNSPGRCWAKHWAECWGRRHARGLRQPRGFSWEVTHKRMYFMEISERRIWQTWRYNPHHGRSWNKPRTHWLDPPVYPSWSTRMGHKLLVSPKRLLTPKSWIVADLWWYVHLHVANLTRRRHLRNPADRQWGSSTEA